MLKRVLEKCPEELEFLQKLPGEDMDPNHIAKLEKVANTEFKKITYTEAVEILANSGKKFEFPTNWEMSYKQNMKGIWRMFISRDQS